MYYGGQQADKMNRPMRRHYSEDGSMEITENLTDGTAAFVFYLDGDAYSAPAIWKEVHTATATASATLYYLHRDHLGSIVMISDVNGGVVEKRQFDAWGNVVAITDGNGNALATFAVLDRGYTGHEHLFGVALINMNGRLYDAKLHRFLSPDNFVQDEYNTQNFNRYGYVLNSPLKYSDKSGEFWQILVGAAISVITNGIGNLNNDRPFFQGAGRAAFIGGINGAASFGIGNAASGINGLLGKAVFQTWAHAHLGGVSSLMSGGDFGSGFLSGGFASLAGSGAQTLFKDITGSAGQFAATTASGAVIGGISAEIGGGDFWDGFRNGAISAGLNHGLHAAIKKILTNEFNKQLRITRSVFSKLANDSYYPDASYGDGEAFGTIANASSRMARFIELVKTTGDYDLKNNRRSIFSEFQLGTEGAYYYNELFRSQDFGNYNFGVAAKAFGLSLDFSQIGAGLYQIKSETSSWRYIKSYFDEPTDHIMIQRGYNHFKK